MQKVLLKNGEYLALENDRLVVKKADILVEDQRIKEIAENIDVEADKVIDARDSFIMPGLVNTHTHAAMSLLRSYADDMELKPWLEEKIWPREAKLNGEHVYWGSMLAFLEMLKSGTTTYADMYFFMDDVAKANLDIGIRGVLARGLISFTDPEGKNIEENVELINKYHKKGEGLITCLFGPHAPYTCFPEYLEKVVAKSKEMGVGIHIHVSETDQEIKDIERDYGKSPVEYLNDLGVFDQHSVLAHCVHLSQEDMEIMKEKKVGVAHNPSSNLKLASGIAEVPKMRDMGIPVGLGTDGASSNNNLNMFEEMHVTSLVHKGVNLNPLLLSAEEVLKMATIEGAKVLGLENEIGSIEVGKKADLILVDLEKAHLYPKADLISNMVYSAQGSDVKTVIVNGKVLVEDYELKSFDEKKILQEAQRVAVELMRD